MNRVMRALNVSVLLLGLLALLDGFTPFRAEAGIPTARQPAVLIDLGDRPAVTDIGQPDETPPAILPDTPMPCPVALRLQNAVAASDNAPRHGISRGWPEPRAPPSLS